MTEEVVVTEEAVAAAEEITVAVGAVEEDNTISKCENSAMA